jgi:hypothetical protein
MAKRLAGATDAAWAENSCVAVIQACCAASIRATAQMYGRRRLKLLNVLPFQPTLASRDRISVHSA